MDRQSERYTQEEVTEIIRRALILESSEGLLSREDLEDVARQSGVSPERLEKAIAAQRETGELEAAKLRILKRKRGEFRGHFTSYLIVNGALVFMNLLTSSYPWVIWCVLGWGMGLAFHAQDAFFPDPETLERDALRDLRREARNRHRETEPASEDAAPLELNLIIRGEKSNA